MIVCVLFMLQQVHKQPERAKPNRRDTKRTDENRCERVGACSCVFVCVYVRAEKETVYVLSNRLM